MRIATLPRRAFASTLAGLVLGAAILLAIFTTREEIGGWNDASRLATVECLVDYGTLAIDRSIYVDSANAPRPPAPPGLIDFGTLDKLWIDGHYYSDKSPVPALLMAGVYRAWQSWTGITACESPERFVWWMTFTSSGIAYVLAVWCIYQLGGPLRLPLSLRLALTASFALATVAPVYAQQVNNHVLLLAVAAGLTLGSAYLARYSPLPCTRGRGVGGEGTPLPRSTGGEGRPMLLIAFLGFLAGLGYTIDLGAGPIIFICFLGLTTYRCRSVKAALIFLVAALPWLALHHAVNYAVGGTFQPANAIHEYLTWPGSPFHAANITGIWNHPSLYRFCRYALDLPFGKRGFLAHNLPLFLAVLGFIFLVRRSWFEKGSGTVVRSTLRAVPATVPDPFLSQDRRRPAELPEIVCAGCCAAGIWLIYASGSNNLSGLCCSVRWFVPLLAPGYFVLAVLLRDYREYRADFYILSGWGALLAAVMCCQGPWTRHLIPGYWFCYAAALLTWGAYHFRRLIAASPGRQYHQDGVDVPIGREEEPGDASVLGGFSAHLRLRDAGPAEDSGRLRNPARQPPRHDSRQGHPPFPGSPEAA